MRVKQPRWKEPQYTKKQINDAGNVLRNSTDTEERQKALEVVDNWRAAHAYPLHAFYMNLRGRAGSDRNILVVERLKRLDSIVAKLQREEGMELYRMHDLGGCRVILPTIADVYSFSSQLENSKILHELKKPYDYIKTPKKSGYRSLHHVYRFKSKAAHKEVFNRYPMLIELQFRTHLQHIWATALETIGLFTNQALKAGQGSEEILRFFVIISSLFALKEGCPVVPGTSDDESVLIEEIRKINEQHHVLDMLGAIRAVISVDSDRVPNSQGYYILQLNYETRTLKRWFFHHSDLEDANKMYDYLENQKGDNPLDIVLVRASSYNVVKRAYPNYFLDIGEFVNIVSEYLN